MRQAHGLLPGFALVAWLLVGCGDSAQSLAASGKALSQKGDHRAAVVQFKASLQKDSNAPEVRHLLGRALLESGDPVNALVELSKASEAKLAPEIVLPDLARALLLNGELKKLTATWGSTQLNEATAQASLKATLARAWSLLGERKKAEDAATAALAAKPDFGPALILQARLLSSQNAHAQALAVLEPLLAREPKLSEAWQLKGEIYWHGLRDTAQASTAFKQALQANPSYMPAHLSLVQVHLVAKDFAAAKRQADALRQALPKHPQVVLVDAQIAFYERNYPRARELVLQLLKGSPNHLGTLQLAGAIEGQSGSLPMAQHYFGKALQINPELPLARRSLAQTQLRLGQAGQTLATLQPLLNKGEGSAEVYALAGEAQLQLGNSPAAEAHFRKASELAPDNVRIRTALALAAASQGDEASGLEQLEALSSKDQDTYADMAIISLRLQRNEAPLALKAAQAMMQKHAQNPSAALTLGRVQLANKRPEAARLAFEQALKLDPALFAATTSLAGLDLLEKKPDRAKARFEAAVQREPRNHLAHLALAELEASQGAAADAVQRRLADAIKAAPGEAQPRLLLINHLLESKSHKEALSAAQEAATALPTDAGVLEALGRALAESGDRLQAVNTFKQLAGLNPSSGLAYVRMADVHKSGGDTAAAEASLRKALDIQPDLAPAQNGLMELLLAAKRPREAVDFAKRVQQRQPKASTGYLFEAAAHLRNNAADAAIDAYRSGLAAVGDAPDLAVALHKVLLAQSRQAQASELAASWTQAHPGDPGFEYQLAVSAISQGDLATAEQKLRRLLQQFPNHALALNNLAWVLVVQGKPGATDFARKAVDLMPGRPALMDTLAMALAADKQVQQALELQKKALALAPHDNGLRLNLAKIALQAKDLALARKELSALNALGAALPYRDEVLKLMASVR